MAPGEREGGGGGGAGATAYTLCIFIHMMHEYATLVVKYGGNAMAGPRAARGDPLLADLASRWQAGEAIVLVHGGGPEIDAALARRRNRHSPDRRQRVTGEATLEITEAVLCGSINKRIVRDLLALGVRAAGVSGQDAGTLIAQRALGQNGEDLGFVGEMSRSTRDSFKRSCPRDTCPSSRRSRWRAARITPINVNADLAAVRKSPRHYTLAPSCS